MNPSKDIIEFMRMKIPFCMNCLVGSFNECMKSHPEKDRFSQVEIDHTFVSFVNGAMRLEDFNHDDETPRQEEMN